MITVLPVGSEPFETDEKGETVTHSAPQRQGSERITKTRKHETEGAESEIGKREVQGSFALSCFGDS
jgi:hypothetical protein